MSANPSTRRAIAEDMLGHALDANGYAPCPWPIRALRLQFPASFHSGIRARSSRKTNPLHHKGLPFCCPFVARFRRNRAHFGAFPARAPGPKKSPKPFIYKELRLKLMEAEVGIEPTDDGFANH